MTPFCHDRDLLLLEPRLFDQGPFRAQRRAAGSDGLLSGTTFTSASADFLSTGLEAGMVLLLYLGTTGEPEGYEVLAVPDAHSLTLSVPRASADAPAQAPVLGAGPHSWAVLSFAPQIAAASADLAERLATMGETAGLEPADFAASDQLRALAAVATASAIYRALADQAGPADPRWVKADHYDAQLAQRLPRLRLVQDADGDGRPERTRTLSHVTLRRR